MNTLLLILFILIFFVIALIIATKLQNKIDSSDGREEFYNRHCFVDHKKEISKEEIKQRQSNPENLLLTQVFYLQSCIKTKNNVDKQFKTIRETLNKLENEYKDNT